MKLTGTLLARAAAVVAISSAAITVAGGQANAQVTYYGAIAISQQTGVAAYANDQSSEAAAKAAAVKSCGAADCEAVVTFANACGAVTNAPDHSWAWANGPTRAAAESTALGLSSKGALVITWACTSRPGVSLPKCWPLCPANVAPQAIVPE